MTDSSELTLDVVRDAVDGEAAAFRYVTRLQPAGGKGDKVFPPTYSVDRDAVTRYALEARMIEGRQVQTVLLDSVASQANRMEEALLHAWESGRLHFPVIAVDFSAEDGIQDLDRITTLQAPHRIADALLRDSVTHEGVRFRDTDAGRAYTDAGARNATAIYRYCPTALVFGVWDSTGPKGGLGNKIQRALVSEIVGVDVVAGVKTASRIDPAGIQANVPIFHRQDAHDDWTADESEAQVKSGKPVPFSRRGAEGKGKPSAVNHSNVAPSIDVLAGGVTFDFALQTTVLSLAALRKLRISSRYDGSAVAPEDRQHIERTVRTVLAALGLCAIAEHRAQGYDLRSRSLLVPEGSENTMVELIPAGGGASRRYHLSPAGASELLLQAAESAVSIGFGWEREPVRLRPAPKLSALIRESRKRAAAGEADEDAAQS